MVSAGRYQFFSPRHGPVTAVRVFGGGGGPAAALRRLEALALLRELEAEVRSGERGHLLALSELVEAGLPIANTSSARLLEGLTGAVDRGDLVLHRGWGTGEGDDADSVEGRANQELAARAMGSAADLVIDGENYVLKTAGAWRAYSDRESFESLRPEQARAVLVRLAAQPRWSKDQREALEQAMTKLADPRKPESRDGLVLLRRGSIGTTWYEEPVEAVTPSRARVREEVESVDPLMDGATTELDTADAELPVSEEPPADADPDADAPQDTDEPETAASDDDTHNEPQ